MTRVVFSVLLEFLAAADEDERELATLSAFGLVLEFAAVLEVAVAVLEVVPELFWTLADVFLPTPLVVLLVSEVALVLYLALEVL